jgi:hypothetical protein
MISGVWGSDLFRSDGRPFQSSSQQSQVTRQLEFEQITLAFHKSVSFGRSYQFNSFAC